MSNEMVSAQNEKQTATPAYAPDAYEVVFIEEIICFDVDREPEVQHACAA